MKRKLLIILLSIVCIFCLVFGLAGCASNDGDSEEYIPAVTSGKRYNDNITYKLSYTSDKECPNGNIDNEKLHTDMDFEVGKVYYMAIDFTISSFEMDGWNSSFSASFKIARSEGVEARLEEVATSNVSEKAEDDSTIITATYSIPEIRTESRTYRMVIRFILQSEKDYITTYFAFYGNNQNNYEYAEKLILMKVTDGLSFNLLENKQGYEVSGENISETDIYIPEYYNGLPVTAISSYGSFQNSPVKSIFIPDTVTEIGKRAFNGCTSLESITIANSVTEIGNSAFNGCTSLESITIPDSITSIGSYTFYGCTSLTNITIPDRVTSIDEHAFTGCTSLESITIPNGVTSIGEYTFYNCIRLVSITIPNSVTEISGNAFRYCTSLESITIPNSVTSICEWAFYGCTSLTGITIPDSVISIGSLAFSNCTSIESVIFKNTNGWHFAISGTSISSSELADPAIAAKYLTDTYYIYDWERS